MGQPRSRPMSSTRWCDTSRVARLTHQARVRACLSAGVRALGMAGCAAVILAAATNVSQARVVARSEAVLLARSVSSRQTSRHAPGAVAASAGRGCRVTSTSSADPNELLGVQFVSPSTGWLVAADRVLATTDGGKRWIVEERTSTTQFNSVDFVDAAHGWVVGTNELLRTADGGRRWQALAEPCPAIDSVDFASPSVGFAVAGAARLRRGRLSGGQHRGVDNRFTAG